ncbi:hypothetical protein [Colwellia sp. Arc7-D]|uniref:hypothetical protein n=1 Tax=Colwellia sp. Arc7-D TaxID=2161872 RepID=UPI000D3A6228|nr:hypothetical protein [Colwellia sp. Arc7-D]AWB58748.1 hypothetical protein DBO93_15080 [Colwellia sp. Arc7-D]
MKIYIQSIIVLLALLVTGCAHQIEINPDMANINQAENKSEKIVGYYISDENKKKKVTSPGGGGDKITYLPYSDLESAFYTALSSKYKDVYSVKSLDESDFINEKGISLIFVPEIETNSSSDSLMTWPATDFSIKLICKAIDANGELVWEKTVESAGHAEFDEFKSDFSLSARRASEQAINLLVEELNNITE